MKINKERRNYKKNVSKWRKLIEMCIRDRYWSMQNSTSYMGAYSEIQGNPFLKPATNYEANISYILKGKYVLTASYLSLIHISILDI